jgi:YggT family protein
MITTVLRNLINLYSWVIVIRVLLPMFNTGRRNALVDLVYKITDPVLQPISKVVKPVRLGNGYIDLGPLILVFVLNLITIWLL